MSQCPFTSPASPGGCSAAHAPTVCIAGQPLGAIRQYLIPSYWLLAAPNGGPGQVIIEIFIWLGVLFVLAFIGILLIRWARRRLIDGEQGQIGGFTLAELRRMHRDGELDDEEFEAARHRLIGQYRAEITESPPQDEGREAADGPESPAPPGASPQQRDGSPGPDNGADDRTDEGAVGGDGGGDVGSGPDRPAG